MRLKAFSFFLIVFAAASLFADEHPNDARGFAADKVYDVHDVDTVNMFNGNLTIRIPLGPSFRANALISYQYALYYNSHVWRFDEIDLPETHYQASPRKPYNAGLGWSLSFGRLTGPNSSADGTRFTFESPDGAEHLFSNAQHGGGAPPLWTQTGYTQDGTYLRMRYVNDRERHIDFPDGTTQVFFLLLPAAGTWQQATASDSVWRLREIRSALENRVTFTYSRSADADVPYYQEIWTVQETKDVVTGAGPAPNQNVIRASTVYFGKTTLSGFDFMALQRIDLPAPPNAGSTSYSFSTVQTSVRNPVYPEDVPVTLLTQIMLPAVNGHSTTYAMTVDGTAIGAPAYETSGQESGLLDKLTLPTLGSIAWSYIRVAFPGEMGGARGPAIAYPIAVYERKTYKPGVTSADGTWHYDRQFGVGSACYDRCQTDPFRCGNSRQLTTWVLPPRTGSDPQYASVNYYSIYDDAIDLCSTPANGWSKDEYGLPFTRYAVRPATNSDPVPERYLSSQVVRDLNVSNLSTWDGNGAITSAPNGPPVPFQSTYITYARPGIAGTDFTLNSSATVYDADSGCGGTCFTATNLYNFDGFGHFRQASTLSNIPADDDNILGNDDQYRTEWKNYPSTLDGNNWVLDTWDKQCAIRDSSPHGEITIPCVSSSLVSHTQFARDTGLLTAQRTLLNGDTTNTHDLLAAQTFDAKGYATAAKYAGADSQSLSGGEFTPPATPTYEINYANTYSSQGGMTARTGSYAQVGLSVLNETYDATSGLTSASADASGVTSNYAYDSRYRLKEVGSPGSATTTYTYTDGTLNGGVFTPATVTVSRQSTSAGEVREKYEYDGFGRVTNRQHLMPSGNMASNQITYTANGLTDKIYETDGTHYTQFSLFDHLNRPTRITAPDDTYSTVEYIGIRQVKRHRWIATAVNSALTEHITTETYDPLHRLRMVDEADNTIHTSYPYDIAGHLKTVSTAGPGMTAPQLRTFTYDARGFLTQEQHPESGATNYSNYDARGHVGLKTVPDPNNECNMQLKRCFDVKYTYDAAERVFNLKVPDPSSPASHDPATFRFFKEFSYANANDGTNKKQGKLETATRHNYHADIGDVTVTETYEYRDAAGRLTNKTTQIGPAGLNKTLEQAYAYNDLGLPSTITYPTCYDIIGCGTSKWGDVQPQYTNGVVSGVPTPAFTSSTNGIAYSDNGMVHTVAHPNGVVDTYETANGMARPASITFSNWTTCASPAILTQPSGGTIYYNDSRTLSVSAGGDNRTYQWYAGQTAIPNETSSALTVAPHQTTDYWVRVTNACGHADSSHATVTVQLRAPTGLIADLTNTNLITVRWNATAGATSYQVWRRSGASWISRGTTGGLSFPDSVSPGATFFYQVTADGSSVTTSPASNNDLESTLSFTGVSANMTISYSHFSELLSAVNAVRAAWGDPAFSWADVLNTSTNPCGYVTVSTIPAPGAIIYAAHLMRLRCAMNNALIRAGITATGYTDPDVTGLVIRAIHVTELQGRTDFVGDGR